MYPSIERPHIGPSTFLFALLFCLVTLTSCSFFAGDTEDVADPVPIRGIDTQGYRSGDLTVTMESPVVGTAGVLVVRLESSETFEALGLDVESDLVRDGEYASFGSGAVETRGFRVPLVLDEVGAFEVSVRLTACRDSDCDDIEEWTVSESFEVKEPPDVLGGDRLPTEPAIPSIDRVGEDSEGLTVVVDELLVVLTWDVEDVGDAVKELAELTDATVIGGIPEIRTYQFVYPSLEAAEAAEEVLDNHPFVEEALLHPAGIGDSAVTPTDYGDEDWETSSSPSGNNWHLELINAPAGWDTRTDASDVTTMIIDLGVNTDHLDLNVAHAWPEENLRPGRDAHGTHVATTACGTANDTVGDSAGMVGVAWDCDLRTYDISGLQKVEGSTDERDSGFAMQFVLGMLDAVEAQAHVVNMSLGWPQDSGNWCRRDEGDQYTRQDGTKGVVPETAVLIERAAEMNALVRRPVELGSNILWVTTAGNECAHIKSGSPKSLGLEFSNVLVVASVDSGGELSFFSGYGESVEVAAGGGSPGVWSADGCDLSLWQEIKFWQSSCEHRDGWYAQGTSMAAPAVTGAASLFRAEFPEASAVQTANCIVTTAEKRRADAPADYAAFVEGEDPRESDDWTRIGILDLRALLEDCDMDGTDAPSGVSDPSEPGSDEEEAFFVPDEQAGVAPVAIVMDISGSMDDADSTGVQKIAGAKTALLDWLDNVETGTPLGLRTYPDQSGTECNHGVARFPIGPRAPSELAPTIRSLRAAGDTPTAEALLATADSMLEAGFDRGTIILVSDGESTCLDPCEAAEAIAASGFSLNFVGVGFDISDGGRSELECIAQEVDGTYLEVTDTVTINDVIERVSVPQVQITATAPDVVLADSGLERAGNRDIVASVFNDSEVAARNVVLRAEMSEVGAGVVAPVQHIGNLGPGETRTVIWTLDPELGLVDTDVAYLLTAQADNSEDFTTQEGRFTVVDAAEAVKPGELIDSRKLVLAGDAFVSGLGTGQCGTDSTYLSALLRVNPQNVMACANTTISGFTYGESQAVPSQLQQLSTRAEENQIDAVVLSLGAADAGIAEFIAACLDAQASCTGDVFGEPTEQFLSQRLSPALTDRVVDLLVGIDAELNSADLTVTSTRPTLVLAFPALFTSPGTACTVGGFSVGSAELRAANQMVADFNGILEGAVAAALELGVAVAFVPDTEQAFLPDHTLCSSQPYADFSSGILGPNENGAVALGQALLRWSNSSEATDGASLLSRDQPSIEASILQETVDTVIAVQAASASAAVTPGSWHELALEGLAENESAQLILDSKQVLWAGSTDPTGRLEAVFVVPPDVANGNHELVVMVAGNANPLPFSKQFDVAPERFPGWAIPAAVGAALWLCALAFTFVWQRRAKAKTLMVAP